MVQIKRIEKDDLLGRWQRAVECDPSFFEAWNNKANAHLALGNAAGKLSPLITLK